MGWGDLGCYGHPAEETPHLDQMANEGMRFTDWYSGSNICSPCKGTLFYLCFIFGIIIMNTLELRNISLKCIHYRWLELQSITNLKRNHVVELLCWSYECFLVSQDRDKL